MSEKLKSLLPLILKGVACLFVVLAFIFMFALPGLSAEAEGMKSSISLFGLVFGNGTIHTEILSKGSDASISGGMSFFALFAFILLIIGIVCFVLGFVLKEKAKLFGLVSGVLFLLAGICAFLVKVAGTDIVVSMGILESLLPGSNVAANVAFTDFFKEYNLGVGSILFAIFNILAGGILVVNELVLNKE